MLAALRQDEAGPIMNSFLERREQAIYARVTFVELCGVMAQARVETLCQRLSVYRI